MKWRVMICKNFQSYDQLFGEEYVLFTKDLEAMAVGGCAIMKHLQSKGKHHV